MIQQQHPIGTGFTPATTAEEVSKGINLIGKNVIVTGGAAGIGREVTRVLSKASQVDVPGHSPNDCNARTEEGDCEGRSGCDETFTHCYDH